MKTLGIAVRGLGWFWLVMTGVHLWGEGFRRLEGPEGKTLLGCLVILAPYTIMGLIAWGLLAGGKYLANRDTRKEQK